MHKACTYPLLTHTDEARPGMCKLQCHRASRSIPGANPAPEGQKAAALKCHTRPDSLFCDPA